MAARKALRSAGALKTVKCHLFQRSVTFATRRRQLFRNVKTFSPRTPAGGREKRPRQSATMPVRAMEGGGRQHAQPEALAKHARLRSMAQANRCSRLPATDEENSAAAQR